MIAARGAGGWALRCARGRPGGWAAREGSAPPQHTQCIASWRVRAESRAAAVLDGVGEMAPVASLVLIISCAAVALPLARAGSFSPKTFSAGVSESRLTQKEVTLCDWSIQRGDLGALTYLWITGDPHVAFAQIRVYVDNESVPSLAYEPAKAAGVANPQGPDGTGTVEGPGGDPGPPSSLVNETEYLKPWGTKWFGQLGRSAYFNTFRVPFQSSIRVTYQSGPGLPDAMLFIQGAPHWHLLPCHSYYHKNLKSPCVEQHVASAVSAQG